MERLFISFSFFEEMLSSSLNLLPRFFGFKNKLNVPIISLILSLI